MSADVQAPNGGPSFVSATDVARALPFGRLVDALREAFGGDTEVPARHVHALPGDGAASEGARSLIMPAWTAEHYGVKIINVAPGNVARGLPGLHGIYALFDAATGVPLAFVDADELTARRTAAASALGADLLAPAGPADLLVVGSGRVAALLPDAMAAVRPLRRVAVWSRTGDNAARLAGRLAAAGHPAEAVTDLEAAVRSSGIVSCATLSTQALVRGRWLREGAHFDLVGSFTPAMRESDGECLSRAEVFVDTPEAMLKAGDILQAVSEGAFQPSALRGTLRQLVRGECRGRSSSRAITLFKAVGSALEDLAGAVLAYRSLQTGRPL